MRLITFISLVILGLSCANTKNIAMKPNRLNGTWVPVQEELGGTSLPKAAFEKQKLIIDDGAYTFITESIDKEVVKYTDDDKMDIYGKEGVNTGKHFTAIYKFVPGASNGETGLLTICYNLSGDSYPETFETRAKPALFLAVFKKETSK